MAEMSLLAVKLLWGVDVEGIGVSERWLEGIHLYTFRRRPPLMCM